MGTAVSALGASAEPRPAVSATGEAEPPADKIPPPVEQVWPQAVHKIPAKLPDGRAYYPQLLLDDRTLLVMTGVNDGKRQFLWSYDLDTGQARKIAEIPPTKGSAIFADGVAAGGGDIVWWSSYKEAGRPRVARIWTVPAAGGRHRPVTDVPLGNVMKQGHINGLTVTGSDVVFAYEKGGVYRVPLSGGVPQPVKGAERHHIRAPARRSSAALAGARTPRGARPSCVGSSATVTAPTSAPCRLASSRATTPAWSASSRSR